MALAALLAGIRRACATIDAVGGGSDLRGLHGGSLLSTADPRRFAAAFADALQSRARLWLASPDWGAARMAELERIAGGASATIPEGSILIATGGTTGRLRFCVHTPETLCASANAFLEFHGGGPHRTLCVLPLWHVSGLMQLFRAGLSGGSVAFGNPSHPAEFPSGFDPSGAFLSLVPTQLKKLIDEGRADTLRRFAAIVVGGAALDEVLADKARALGLPLSPSYGMTETAALVCALKPEEFLAGKKGVGAALPHASVRIVREDGGIACAERPGRIVVRAASLCTGFAPEAGAIGGALETNDLGYFDDSGSLRVTGRADRVIVSGGEKLDAGEIECAIAATGLVTEVVVIALPDPKWGQIAA
ncbi:MAG TPA: AMP-binding protein, partial [Opitutales bacterium]|nr:AMP-binding protein [Opitutales bacterium]